MKCPVCKQNRNNETFCTQCAWEFKTYVQELSAEEKKLYETRLAIAIRNWERLHTVNAGSPSEKTTKPTAEKQPEPPKPLYSENTPVPELKRDLFDTLEMFIERIRNYPPVLAGTGLLIKEKGDKRYDIITGKFPVEIKWKDWVKGIHGFPHHHTEAHVLAEAKLAKAIYEAGPSHPVFVKLKADGETVFFQHAELVTKQSVFTVEGLSKPNSNKGLSKPNSQKTLTLRNIPKTLNENKVKTMLQRYNFYDRDYNPNGKFQGDLVDNGDGTLTDRTTDLIWEKAGSESAIPYNEAHRYVQRLREQKGKDWRLPTLEELASLLVNQETNGLFIHPLFDRTQQYCWSCDTDTLGRGWVVVFYYGFVNCNNLHNSYYVRAVRSR